eukprot:1812412-Prymnesium_polylepis.2
MLARLQRYAAVHRHPPRSIDTGRPDACDYTARSLQEPGREWARDTRVVGTDVQDPTLLTNALPSPASGRSPSALAPRVDRCGV